MKLKQISEDYMSAKLKEALSSRNYFDRPFVQTSSFNNGNDSGSRVAGYSYLTTGVPKKRRHRIALGLSSRPGSINL